MALLFAGYQAINAWVQNADMILAVRLLAFGTYPVVLYVYGPDAWNAARTNEPKRSDFLIAGIWLGFLSYWIHDAYAIMYRLAPSSWLLNSEIVSPIMMLSIVAAILHVAAPGAVDGVVPRRTRIALGVGIGCSVFLVGLLLTSRPDVRPWIDDLKPWISDWWSTGSLSSNPHA